MQFIPISEGFTDLTESFDSLNRSISDLSNLTTITDSSTTLISESAEDLETDIKKMYEKEEYGLSVVALRPQSRSKISFPDWFPSESLTMPLSGYCFNGNTQHPIFPVSPNPSLCSEISDSQTEFGDELLEMSLLENMPELSDSLDDAEDNCDIDELIRWPQTPLPSQQIVWSSRQEKLQAASSKVVARREENIKGDISGEIPNRTADIRTQATATNQEPVQQPQSLLLQQAPGNSQSTHRRSVKRGSTNDGDGDKKVKRAKTVRTKAGRRTRKVRRFKIVKKPMTRKVKVATRRSHGLSTGTKRIQFVCPTCERGFTNKSLLKRHIDCVHLQLARYPCPYCEMKFKRTDHLNLHLRRKHPDQSQ